MRGNLIVEYFRLVHELRPRFFVFENVANLVTAALRHRPISRRPGQRWNLASYSSQLALGLDGDGNEPLAANELSGSAIRYLLSTIVAEIGYSVSLGVLDAAEFGAPQRRLRFIMLGARDEAAPSLPSPTHGPERLPFLTVKDAIADLRNQPGPGSEYTARVREVFGMVPPGCNWRSLPPDKARAAMGEASYAAGGGKTGFYRRLAWDEPAPTITGRANRKGFGAVPPGVRQALVREGMCPASGLSR